MSERETLAYDVVVVGAGPAGLACAVRLKQLDPERSVCVLEKGAEPGAQLLSGAVLEPAILDALWPEWRDDPPATCVPVTRDRFALLTGRRDIRLPTPPQQKNRGNFIVSLGELGAKLAAYAESLGVEVYPGFPAESELVGDDGAVIGVRCRDMGLDRDGNPGPNHAPGVDLHAPVTVLAEGCRGSVTKRLIGRFGLDEGRAPQTYGIGLKEMWQLPAGRGDPGRVEHTIGWPLPNDVYGGSFIYHLENDRVVLGFVIGLDYADPWLEPFELFQRFKHHPSVRSLLEGGELLKTGARALIEGGWQSLPHLDMPGALLIGDAAGTLNVAKIKGIHQALASGMLAAEHIAEHGRTEGFDALWRASPGARELERVRNIRPGFRHGLWAGLANAALETVTFGKMPWTLANHADWKALRKIAVSRCKGTAPTGTAPTGTAPTGTAPEENRGAKAPLPPLPPRDRLASVYHADLSHDENQPVHLKVADTDICATRCVVEYANPCTRFCPAGVYEMVDDGDGGKKLQINAANCVHCKVCDIKDPYGIIDWTVPEGGSGPNYQNM